MNEQGLKLDNAFYKAYKFWGRRNFINGLTIPLHALKPHNFAHVLSRKQYHYFKYYPKNIVILSLSQHTIYDQGTVRDLIEKRIQPKKDKKEAWKRLFTLKGELKREYKEWVKNNRHQYKT